MNLNDLDNKENSNFDNKGYFPISYYEGFLDFLYKNRSIIEIITYDDLDWGEDFDYRNNYPLEWKRWKDNLKNGVLDKNKIYVLLQHDVDANPERTDKILSLEDSFNCKSCNMLFNKRVKRRTLQSTGKLEFDEEGYQINYPKWKEFENKGFIFCYHANSFEQSNFDYEKSLITFSNDVFHLRKMFSINYYSPHGGARSPSGESNNSLSIPVDLEKSIRWVANGHTVRFDGVYSDGGPNSKNRDPSKRDLKDFVATWELGRRYRVLTHPQYYFEPCGISERLNEAGWYREMQHCYNVLRGDYWADAKFAEKVESSNDVVLKNKVSNGIYFFRKINKLIKIMKNIMVK